METKVNLQTLYDHLICSKTGRRYPRQIRHTYSDAGYPLLARYRLFEGLSREVLKGRPFTMWRYRELLPLDHDRYRISLGEGGTPLRRLERSGPKFGIPELWLKDEAGNPTGSFKARGLSMAVSKALELGTRKFVIPTAGNAGGALSAYCARAGAKARVFMPRQTPVLFQRECSLFGADVSLVEGNISDCAHRIAQECGPEWFDVSTMKEPFRLEGKKTMGYEIAEQFHWEVPDVILYPTGGGTGLIGIWKAMQEMTELGWISGKMPRMVAVQAEVCSPIVRAFDAGASKAKPWQDPGLTIANGLRVPGAFAHELILSILRESEGTAVAVSEEEMREGLSEMARLEGVLLAPEGAAVWKAFVRLRESGWIRKGEKAVLLNTGTVYKYMENIIADFGD